MEALPQIITACGARGWSVLAPLAPNTYRSDSNAGGGSAARGRPRVREWASTADEADALKACVEEATEWADVDPAAVYLTGVSMGGLGAYMLAARSPRRPDAGSSATPVARADSGSASAFGSKENADSASTSFAQKTLPVSSPCAPITSPSPPPPPPPPPRFRGFAAVVPVCGGGRPLFAGLAAANCRRWWFFHARDDVVIGAEESEALATAIRSAASTTGSRCHGRAHAATAGAAVEGAHHRAARAGEVPAEGGVGEPPCGAEEAADVRCTVYATAPAPATRGCGWMGGHASWREAYAEPGLWDWLEVSRLHPLH